MPVIGQLIDLDEGQEYFCVVCEMRHDGKECPHCERLSETLAAEMRVIEVVVKVRHKIYFKKGSLAKVKSMIDPRQHVIGRDNELGDYRLQAIGVEPNGK